MRIVKATVEFITPMNEEIVLKRLEECGRVCYKSEDRITSDSSSKFVKALIKNGHESVLEHCSFSVKFTIDRAISHELVRHRLASYSQESTRYCNYSKSKFGSEITVVEPFFFSSNPERYKIWKESCEASERAYFDLLKAGCTPQEARSVLPNSLKTEIVMTANIREWRHFLKMRSSFGAHPQMKEVSMKLLEMLNESMPTLFEDIAKTVFNQDTK